MTTNPFFSVTKQTNEQDLYESLMIETIQINGIDCYFLPRTLINKDAFFKEDPLSQFTKAKPLELYLETVEGWEGEQDFISKFGLEIRDQATFVCSKRRWKSIVGNIQPIPHEGDLIYLPMNKTLWSVRFVEDEQPFYQRGRIATYRFMCNLFDFSQERLDTGVDEIDEIETAFSDADTGGDIVNDPFAENDDIQTEATDVVDNSESSPFGGNV